MALNQAIMDELIRKAVSIYGEEAVLSVKDRLYYVEQSTVWDENPTRYVIMLRSENPNEKAEVYVEMS